MILFLITGTCGSGKSTVINVLKQKLDKNFFACYDDDELGLNWWDYAGTDHEYKFSDDCLAMAVKLSGGKNIVMSSCIFPYDYIGLHTVPSQVDSTHFIVLSADNNVIEKRLKNRPKERGFVSDEKIKPHLEYNTWFINRKNKFNLFVDNTNLSLQDTVYQILKYIKKVTM